MKLLRLRIIKADTCGGLLDGLDINFRQGITDPAGLTNTFSPLCLIGPNGTGKSQILQIIAEIFQATFHRFLPEEEQASDTGNIEFEIEYYITVPGNCPEKVRIYRRKTGRAKADIAIERFSEDNWVLIPDTDTEIIKTLLPSKVIGYTSGDNETLSIPFFVSRAGYAKKVSQNALKKELRSKPINDTRMLLIDYGTNLEVLIANLLLNQSHVREKLLDEPNLKEIRSFRCVIQLKHAAAKTKGILLTKELEDYVEFLKKCATCYNHDQPTNSYSFDFFITSESHKGFSHFWKGGALELYSCFHKLAMLNDLIIPKKARQAFDKGVKSRKFSSRLPEPFEDDKVFRFERVEFISKKSDKSVDYVSLSDGEHQLAQLLGTFCMTSFPNALFLLDEPESHFNPKWRIEFIQKIMNLPTENGGRSDSSEVAQQECLLTTHSPFVPSDMQKENVLIFNKNIEKDKIEYRMPRIQTYGSKFDAILSESFGITPPISAISRDQIDALIKNGTADEIREVIKTLGDSTHKMKLAAKLSILEQE